MATSDDDIVSETISPINILLMEKLNVLESHKQVAIRAYRLAESSEESKYRKLVEGLKLQLNILYFNIPTGTVDAFEMIKLVKNHYESLESLITEIEGGDNGKAEG